jgi:hypothetical protein
MKSIATERFWRSYETLPPRVQHRAQSIYRLWQADSFHPSLDFKQVHARRPIFSVRIGLGWRALGVRDGETMVWFWIGSHADYDKLLTRL